MKNTQPTFKGACCALITPFSQSGALDLGAFCALCEAQIESLVIAKGYADCVAYLGDGTVSVAVASPEGGLQQTDVALISDIVTSQTDCDLADLRIIGVK